VGYRLVAALPRSAASYYRYRRSAPPDRRPRLAHLYPCLGDATAETPVEPICFYQDAWAFEKIVAARPAWHLDVGSQHTFVALLSKAVPVTMVDLRATDAGRVSSPNGSRVSAWGATTSGGPAVDGAGILPC
jgi:hypothetical protein